MSAHALAEAAEALVGSRFRLHGRNPETGLDCIGVLAASLAAVGRSAPLPTGYPLRVMRLDGWLPEPEVCGFEIVTDQGLAAGDVILLGCPGSQVHLAVATAGGFVHAHAALGRVVLSPSRPDGPVIGHWRLAS